jgi:hypothetical protein
MKLKLLIRNSAKILSFTLFSLVLLLTIPCEAQTITNNTQGTNNGFFYSFWNDGSSGSASMTLGAAGNYSTTWSSIGNFTAGKGWATGSPNRVICFSGSFNGGTNGYLAIYGWTKNSLIEYYVVENHGGWTPPGGTSLGTFTSDGGTYNVYKMQRVNAPNITGTNQNFDQYWSVRTSTRSSGTVTFANHVAAWASHGMPMGSTWDYQILETEGYMSSGNSNVTVSECTTSSCTTAAPTATLTYNYGVGDAATQLTATGTALKWYADNTTTTALSGAPTPSTANVGTTKYYVSQTLNGCEGPRTEITVNVSVRYKIYKVPSPITIDGTPDAAWSNASVLSAAATKLISGAVSNNADLSGNFKALWDDTYLYVLADVSDDVLVNESTNVYDDDGVEVYVDINNDKATTYGANDVQYSFGWNDGTTVGSLPAGRSTSGITYAAVARTGGYVVETRIPWSTLQGSPAIGQLVGMDFMINDDDDGGTRDGKLSWNSTTDDAWENPSLFGTAILQGTLPCTTPAAPGVVTPVTYCQNATPAALTATGTSLLWYTSATGGTGTSTLTPVTTSAGSVNYYVSQNVSGCESSRALIVVTVNALPSAPSVTSPVTYCQNAVATALTASGTALKWYTAASSGTALGSAPSPNTGSTGTTNYYVSQTTNGCEGPRATIAVTVNSLPSTPSVTSPVTYCQNDAATALTASGTALKWYIAASSGTALGSAPSPNTGSTGTTNYYVSQTTNGCEGPRATIAVTVNSLPSVPSVSTPVTYCQNAAATALTATGTALKWYTVSTGGNELANVPTPTTGSAGTTNYYVSQTTNGCESQRAMIAVTVNSLPSAPTVASPVIYCQNASATALTASGTSLKWYTVSSGGTGSASAPTPVTTAAGTTNNYVSQTISGCESERSLLAVTVNATPGAPVVTSPVTYCQNATATALSATGTALQWYTGSTGGTGSVTAPTPSTSAIGTTNYYVSQTINTCESPRAMIAVTINTAATATISAGASTTFCQGGSVTLTANAGTSYIWFNGANQVGTNSTYTATTSGSYTVQITNPSGCSGQVTSGVTTVTVNPLPAAPAVTPTVTYCQNATAGALTATGTALKWYTVSTGGNELANVPTPTTGSAGTTNYYVSQTTNGCESPRAMIAVTVNSLPSAPTVASPVIYCQNASATALTASGTSLKWYTVSSGGTGSASAPTPVTTAAGTTNNYVSQTISGCESERSLLAVTVNATPGAPVVTSPVTYCQNATATALSATGTALQWYTGSTGGTGSVTAPIPSTSAIGTTNYYVSQTINTCESPRAMIAVTINTAATATISAGGSTTFCQGGSVTLTANAGTSYIWFNGATQVGTNSTYTANTSGSYTVQITNPSGCSGQVTSGVTTVTVNPLPAAPAVTPVTYCQNATAAALTAIGTALKWYTVPIGGNELASAPTPATGLAGTTNYYVSQTTNGCEGSRASMTVTVNAIPAAVITPSGPLTFVEGGDVVLQANTGSGLTYQWYKGNTPAGTGANYTATETGSYTVAVTNAFGCTATSQPTNVTVNTNQPSVITITSPAPNTTVVGAITITVNVSDPDGSVTLVEFLDGTTVIGTSTTAPYSFVWNNPSAGDHSITVRVTDSNGGVTTSTPTLVTSGTSTGILSSFATINGNVYPNPTNGLVNIDSDVDLSNASITVVDVLGRDAIHSSVIIGSGAKVDLSGLSDGVYIIIVKQGNSMLRKKVTVNSNRGQ